MGKIKNIITIFSLLAAFAGSARPALAGNDMRAMQMHTYLEKVGSPMAGYEVKLIVTAEKNGLDWTFLAAIAGTESTFGKRMPYECINPYGWGIYGDHKICFKSFDEAIEVVGAGLGKKYNKTSLETIARTYNKVSTEGWITHTRFFMNKIKNTPVSAQHLSIEI